MNYTLTLGYSLVLFDPHIVEREFSTFSWGRKWRATFLFENAQFPNSILHRVGVIIKSSGGGQREEN